MVRMYHDRLRVPLQLPRQEAQGRTPNGTLLRGRDAVSHVSEKTGAPLGKGNRTHQLAPNEVIVKGTVASTLSIPHAASHLAAALLARV